MTMPNWDFTGSTMVTPNYIRLTPDVQSKSGALWNLAVSATFYLLSHKIYYSNRNGQFVFNNFFSLL